MNLCPSNYPRHAERNLTALSSPSSARPGQDTGCSSWASAKVTDHRGGALDTSSPVLVLIVAMVRCTPRPPCGRRRELKRRSRTRPARSPLHAHWPYAPPARMPAARQRRISLASLERQRFGVAYFFSAMQHDPPHPQIPSSPIPLARGQRCRWGIDAGRASAMGRPGSLAGWINSPPKAAPCSRRVRPHASIALAGCQAATPARWPILALSHRNILPQFYRSPDGCLLPFPGTPRATRSGTRTGTRIPTLMGTQATRVPGEPPGRPITAGQVAQRAERDRGARRQSTVADRAGGPPASLRRSSEGDQSLW
jgi:hypothetical protein